jgi:cyclic pyranopterin phosphate synthase
MMLDQFGRRIDYLRISVTDRCNLRCRYCWTEHELPRLDRSEMLTFEEIRDFSQVAISMGLTKIRLTGGEPLVRRGIVTLVSMLSRLQGLIDLSLTTNGVLLSEYAKPLAHAGLMRVNISLDTVDSRRFTYLTGGGDLQRVLAGIEHALAAGFSRIKLNCVCENSSTENDAQAVASYGRQLGVQVRFIKRMELASGSFSVVEGGTGGDCPRCNRLRLTCEGMLRPCLFSDLAFSIRELGAREAITQACANKPESGRCCVNNTFSRIGG